MPLSDPTKESILGRAHDVTPHSEELRRKAKWHLERAGSLKNAKMAKAAPMLFHAELAERTPHDGDYEGDFHNFAFR